MDELEQAIEERQQKICRLEKEVAQAKELLASAQRELEVLLTARQIVSREKLVEKFVHDAAQLAINDFAVGRILSSTSVPMHAFDVDTSSILASSHHGTQPYHGITLVDEVKAILSDSPWPLGPTEIRTHLARGGRVVPQNVMTGMLSRLAKDNRIVRESRGKYRPKTEES